MAPPSPVVLIIGSLFVIWIYFTIHQFWSTPQLDTESSVMHTLFYHGKRQRISGGGDEQHSPFHDRAINTSTTTTTTLSSPVSLPSSAPTHAPSSVPTLTPSEIAIQDPYLSAHDEQELTFEFENDHHLYLYDVPYFYNDSIFIMSMVTNSSGRALAQQLQTLDEISCLFRRTFYLIFESNSQDDTPQMLQQWMQNGNSNASAHRVFCQRYMHGLHRKRTHEFRETGDYANQLFTDGESKRASIQQMVHARYQSASTVINKTVLIGDEWAAHDMQSFRASVKTPFLDRIEKYSLYRNMLLSAMRDMLHANDDDEDEDDRWFDYLMILDLDIYGFQHRLFFSELFHYHRQQRHHQHNGNIALCAHGTLAHGFYRDAFASVGLTHQWYYEYQRNTTYLNDTDLYLKNFPKQRLQAMRSCFGGVVAYSNVDAILDSQCNYDVAWSAYDVPVSVPQSVVDAQHSQVTHFANLMREWRLPRKSKTRRYKKRDNHICEHIPFHYCLHSTQNYSFAIAKYAYLFYEPAAMYRLDINERLIEQTPAPTTESAKQRRKRERTEALQRKKELVKQLN